MKPRVRFAPSPTGYLHVGGARTALFNWLYARRHGGMFVLRIEDTDAGRSSPEMVTGILDGLRWLGLDWDEGPEKGGPHAPYFQSERLQHYRAAAEALLSSGQAYEDGGAIRFKVPDGRTMFRDAVHGDIAFENAHIEPFVVLRSDGRPTYHLSVVVDDIAMEITHVVRGDDHISNTPKQVLLYQAFGKPVPAFAHVPLILGPDKKRLSKRHGATSVMEYARAGYLPAAMTNFLALLGWSPGAGDREIFTRDELIARFDLDGIGGGNAVFNTEKLDWINQQYLLEMPDAALVHALRPWLDAAGLGPEGAHADTPEWNRILPLLRPRAKTLSEFVDQLRPFLRDPAEYDPAAVSKHLDSPQLALGLRAWREAYQESAHDEASLEQTLRRLADERALKAAALIHATRIAVTGGMTSPGLFQMLVVLGRDRVLRRLDRLIDFLARSPVGEPRA